MLLCGVSLFFKIFFYSFTLCPALLGSADCGLWRFKQVLLIKLHNCAAGLLRLIVWPWWQCVCYPTNRPSTAALLSSSDAEDEESRKWEMPQIIRSAFQNKRQNALVLTYSSCDLKPTRRLGRPALLSRVMCFYYVGYHVFLLHLCGS